MRSFHDGDKIDVEPWRAGPFSVIKDLVVDRSAFDQIIHAGGFISAPTGAAPDASTVLVPKTSAAAAFDAATCIGCGAYVAACPTVRPRCSSDEDHPPRRPAPKDRAGRDTRVLARIDQHDGRLRRLHPDRRVHRPCAPKASSSASSPATTKTSSPRYNTTSPDRAHHAHGTVTLRRYCPLSGAGSGHAGQRRLPVVQAGSVSTRAGRPRRLAVLASRRCARRDGKSSRQFLFVSRTYEGATGRFPSSARIVGTNLPFPTSWIMCRTPCTESVPAAVRKAPMCPGVNAGASSR